VQIGIRRQNTKAFPC